MDTQDPNDIDTGTRISSIEAPRSDGTAVSNLELRRAVLGILLFGARPMGLAEVERALLAIGIVTRPRSVRGSNQVLSDLLGYQSRLGRVHRVAHGSDVAVPDAMSISMRWRCQRVVVMWSCGPEVVRSSALRRDGR